MTVPRLTTVKGRQSGTIRTLQVGRSNDNPGKPVPAISRIYGDVRLHQRLIIRIRSNEPVCAYLDRNGRN